MGNNKPDYVTTGAGTMVEHKITKDQQIKSEQQRKD
jgi:hypothetical protein